MAGDKHPRNEHSVGGHALDWIDDELSMLDEQGLLRRQVAHVGPQGATIAIGSRQCINFGSNDYLGLAGDRELTEAVRLVLDSEGFGSGASPLLAGRGAAHERLEAELADFEGTAAALLFSSGFAANLAAITSVVGRGDAIFADEMNHASLIDGCRLSRATVHVYPHADWRRLGEMIDQCGPARRRLIVIDSLFSMDGDLAPLVQIADIAERTGAMLMVDEAHGTGVFGARGRGVAEHLEVSDRIDICVGTLSKALGGAGGFVAGRRSLIDWIVNRGRSYIFSTAPPAAVCAAASAALKIVRDEPQRRRRLLTSAARLRTELAAQGWNVGPSQSQIVPVVVGAADQAVALAEELWSRGIYAPAIRPPSVPAGACRLRISLTAGHTEAMIAQLTATLSELAVQYCVGSTR